MLHHITCMTGLCWCHGAILFLPFSLTYLSWWAPNARCLVAGDAFTCFSDNDRRHCRSVSGTNVFIAAWKRVDITSNIFCNIETGTYLIEARWLADTWVYFTVLRRSPCMCSVTFCIINFSILLYIIFLRTFYCKMKGIQSYAANFLSYIPTKYY